MLEALNDFILTITDPILGWMLMLPLDVVLIVVALLTALVLTAVRLITTDQAYLGRCKQDKKRLKELGKEAKRAGDKEARARYRTTMGQLGMRQLAAEGKPLLVSLVPIALLASWAFARIAFLPPMPGDPVTVNAYFPAPRIGERVHMLPVDGLTADNGLIQRVRPVEEGDFAYGFYGAMASWDVRGEASDEPYNMVIRVAGEGYDMPFIVDGRYYATPVKLITDAPVQAMTVDLTEYKPFGVVPGAPSLMIQPWIVGYLVVVIPLAFVLKPALRIH